VLSTGTTMKNAVFWDVTPCGHVALMRTNVSLEHVTPIITLNKISELRMLAVTSNYKLSPLIMTGVMNIFLNQSKGNVGQNIKLQNEATVKLADKGKINVILITYSSDSVGLQNFTGIQGDHINTHIGLKWPVSYSNTISHQDYIFLDCVLINSMEQSSN
jgi:hypothetical protein